jgi:hypothetical protein
MARQALEMHGINDELGFGRLGAPVDDKGILRDGTGTYVLTK